jgi:hypothetical protein
MNDDAKSGLIAISFVVLIGYGWFANLYKLSQCDFDRPFKAETFRIIGAVVFPVGVVMGYFNIEDD